MAQDKVLQKDAAGSNVSRAAVKDNQDNYSLVDVSKGFNLAVSMGQIDGYSPLDKFGVNPSVAPAMVNI